MISPIKAEIISITMKKIKLKLSCKFKINAKNKLKNKEVVIPPKRPSIVLLGLIFVSFFLPKNFPEIYEKTSNVITVKINKLKFVKYSLLKFILKKNINDIKT